MTSIITRGYADASFLIPSRGYGGQAIVIPILEEIIGHTSIKFTIENEGIMFEIIHGDGFIKYLIDQGSLFNEIVKNESNIKKEMRNDSLLMIKMERKSLNG